MNNSKHRHSNAHKPKSWQQQTPYIKYVAQHGGMGLLQWMLPSYEKGSLPVQAINAKKTLQSKIDDGTFAGLDTNSAIKAIDNQISQLAQNRFTQLMQQNPAALEALVAAPAAQQFVFAQCLDMQTGVYQSLNSATPTQFVINVVDGTPIGKNGARASA